MERIFGPTFPMGTLAVNVTGSFLIALVAELAGRTTAISPELRLFLTTGVMGGYTTYSSFNQETLRLAHDGSAVLGTLNVVLTVAGCAAAGLLGMAAARMLAGGAGR